MIEENRPETKRLVLGSAICRAGGAPADGGGTKGKEEEEEAEFVQKSRRKTRGAAAAAFIAMATGLSLNPGEKENMRKERENVGS